MNKINEILVEGYQKGMLLDVVYEQLENEAKTNSSIIEALILLHNNSEIDILQELWKLDNKPDLEKKFFLMRNIFPLVLMACRHYRLPVPLSFILGYTKEP